MSEAAQRPDTNDPFTDLVSELQAFHTGVTRPNGISMVGSMLQSGTDPQLRTLYQQRIVTPRRERLRHILQRAADDGLLAPAADLDYAVAACTGTLYALHLAGKTTRRTWPARTAKLIWAALGGKPQ